MFKRYWRYPIRKGWDYELTTLQKDHNIFCYGKVNSGKTEKVAAQVLLHAIERDRSCIVFQSATSPALDELYVLAGQRGYEFEDIQEDEFMEMEDLDTIAHAVVERKMIVFVHPDDCEYDFSPMNMSNFMEMVAGLLDEMPDSFDGLGDATSDSCKIHVILDGVDRGFAIRLFWLKQAQFVFCILSKCNFLSLTWVADQVDAYLRELVDCGMLKTHGLYNFLHFAVDQLCDPRDVADTMRNPVDNLQEFFEHFSTIASAGLDSVSPETQKATLASVVFARDKSVNAGGRFIISELEDRFEAAAYKNKICTASSGNGRGVCDGTRPIEVSGEIEDSIYGALSYAIASKLWAVMIDGRILTYYGGEMYGPVLCMDKPEAKAWLSNYVLSQGYQLHPISETDNELVYGYKWRDHEGASHEMRFSIVEITNDNKEQMKDNFLINVLEIEDIEARLERYETHYQDRLGGSPYWSRKLIHYFPESIEYFKLFTYIHKIEERERMEEEAELKRMANKPLEVPEEYRWHPYVEQGSKGEDIIMADFDPFEVLPKDGVLFLGGHQNMTKKLRNIFPGWTFLSDDLFRSWTAKKLNAVFYWYNHSSHSMMKYVNARKDGDVPYVYVTATNIDRLIKEMADQYIANTVQKAV